MLFIVARKFLRHSTAVQKHVKYRFYRVGYVWQVFYLLTRKGKNFVGITLKIQNFMHGEIRVRCDDILLVW